MKTKLTRIHPSMKPAHDGHIQIDPRELRSCDDCKALKRADHLTAYRDAGKVIFQCADKSKCKLANKTP